MVSRPRLCLIAITDALFEVSPARAAAIADDVLAFVACASLPVRLALRAALLLVRFAPLLAFVSWRPLERLPRDRRVSLLGALEGTRLGLALLGWRALVVMHFYEDATELVRIGYGRRVPPPLESGVRVVAAAAQRGAA